MAHRAFSRQNDKRKVGDIDKWTLEGEDATVWYDDEADDCERFMRHRWSYLHVNDPIKDTFVQMMQLWHDKNVQSTQTAQPHWGPFQDWITCLEEFNIDIILGAMLQNVP